MLTTVELNEIIELEKMSTASKISGIDGCCIEGGEELEHYPFAKFDTEYDAAYAFSLLKHGAEMAAEILRLRELVKWTPVQDFVPSGVTETFSEDMEVAAHGKIWSPAVFIKKSLPPFEKGDWWSGGKPISRDIEITHVRRPIPPAPERGE